MAKSGDTQAWSRITDLYGPIVFQICQKKGLQESDAHDVTQEIFVSIYKSLDRFRKTDAQHSFLKWVNAITRNRIADFYRAKEKTPQAFGGSEGLKMVENRSSMKEDPDDEFEMDSLRRQLASRALALLKRDFKPNTWQAFYMTMVEGRTTREAADELKMSDAGVRVARMRVRNRLKEEFGDVL